MSENYQYSDCKHCGKSIMEGEIHNCRQMLLAEIAYSHATILRQAKNITRMHDEIGRLRSALNKIVAVADSDVLICEPNVFDVAREALADRP